MVENIANGGRPDKCFIRFKNQQEAKIIEANNRELEKGDPASFIFGAGNFTIEKLLEAGKAMDRQGLTKAGRSLAKHGGRNPTVFPKPVGNPADINLQGQQMLEKILNHPEKNIVHKINARYDEFVNIYTPIGGVRFTANGDLVGFLQPN